MKTGYWIAILTTCAYGREEYKQRIPNPDGVNGVNAMGHVDGVNGGGPRNPFGVDFEAEGLSWTKDLCNKDSDDDGKTNGEELGDPCCLWTPTNGATLITTGLSHPGDASSTTTSADLDVKTCQSADDDGNGSAVDKTAGFLILSVVLVALPIALL